MHFKYILKLYKTRLQKRFIGRKLTARQKTFIWVWLENGGNAAQAARDAGYCSHGDKYARQAGAQVLRSKAIQAAILAALKEIDKEPTIYDLALTHKERRFVDWWMYQPCITSAARFAGYSQQYARQIGWQVLQRPHVRQAMRERYEELRVQSFVRKMESMKQEGYER